MTNQSKTEEARSQGVGDSMMLASTQTSAASYILLCNNTRLTDSVVTSLMVQSLAHHPQAPIESHSEIHRTGRRKDWLLPLSEVGSGLFFKQVTSGGAGVGLASSSYQYSNVHLKNEMVMACIAECQHDRIASSSSGSFRNFVFSKATTHVNGPLVTHRSSRQGTASGPC